LNAILDSKVLERRGWRNGHRYCLIAVGISIVIVTAVNGIGTSLNATFVSVNNSLK